jgi:hypothetical protein
MANLLVAANSRQRAANSGPPAAGSGQGTDDSGQGGCRLSAVGCPLHSCLAALSFAAAVLSKVYPLVLMPLVARRLQRVGGWKNAAASLLVALGVIAAAYGLCWPRQDGASKGRSPLRGLEVFVTEWEMNDLAFHLIWAGVDRLWPAKSQAAFIAWAGDSWPRRVAKEDAVGGMSVSPSFVLTVGVVGAAIGGLAVGLAVRPARGEPGAWLHAVFLVLVSLFLFGPTANPWYLLWVIPFLPWSRMRAWFLLPAVVLQYYLRFWFIYHFPHEGPPVPGTALDGQDFFNDVWMWIEWLPFFALLAGEFLYRRHVGGRGEKVGNLPPFPPQHSTRGSTSGSTW